MVTPVVVVAVNVVTVMLLMHDLLVIHTTDPKCSRYFLTRSCAFRVQCPGGRVGIRLG